MNSQKLSSFILGVFTTAVASSLLFASHTNQRQTNATSVQSQVADVHSQNVLLADGSGPVPKPPVQLQNVLLADGSGPVPKPPVQLQNVLLADGSGPVPKPPVQLQNVLLADGSGPVPKPPVQPKSALNLHSA